MRRELGAWPGGDHDWQEDFFARYMMSEKRVFFFCAPPAAGKTRLYLRCLHFGLRSGRARRAVFIVPTDALKGQVATAAAAVGLQLNPYAVNRDMVAGDYHGLVFTMQAVAANPEYHRALCGEMPTDVVIDEIHHAGQADNLRYGDAFRHAFEPARRIIIGTGTGWREDKATIPFVQYDQDTDGKCSSRPDCSYTYEQALDGKIVCPAFFPSFEGETHWTSHDGKECHAQTLGEKLADDLASERLRTVLDPRGDWITGIVHRANEKLTFVRAQGHPEAGAIIVARDQDHARALADVVRRTTHENPFLAISDDGTTYEDIQRWSLGQGRWIVAVRMVSEGIDIPRLRVGVYATNILTRLFFYQFLGRLLRKVRGLEGAQEAYLFVPNVAPLPVYAEEIKCQRDHVFTQELARDEVEEDESEGTGTGESREPNLFQPGGSSGPFDHDLIHDGERYTPDELAQAQRVRQQAQVAVEISDVVIMRILRAHGGTPVQPEPVQMPLPEPLHKVKRALRTQAQTYVNRLHHALRERVDHRTINDFVSKRTGCYLTDGDVSEGALRQRLELLKKLLTDLGYARQCFGLPDDTA